MVTSKHAGFISESNAAYEEQLDIPWVGPYDIGVEWDGYSSRVTASDADTTVTNVSELMTAIDSASTGETIWMEDGTYDVTSESRRDDLPDNATLAGDGARILQTEPKSGIFNITGTGARLTGLVIEGPETGTVSDYGTSRAVFARGNCEIDNCVIFGHPISAVYVGEGSAQTEPSEILTPHIHHNYIVDNRDDSEGYGIVTYNGDPLLEYNFLNNNRHDIAGGGYDWAYYRAYNNLHGTEGLIFQNEQHAPGGVRMEVQHAEMRRTVRNNGSTDARAYAQRGTPQESATISDNWIYNPNPPSTQPTTAGDDAIVQYNHGSDDWVNVSFSNNHYGESEPSDDSIGIQELTDLNATTPTHTLDVTLEDADGNALEGSVDIRRVE